ncbi:MAG: NAD(P)/FAD-dependent oxidoreductase [Solirubrobacterales bacterium]
MSTAAVVGSGPNGLAAAVTLAAAGIDVTVYEAAERIGGGTRSSELTLPGLIHDECSAAHPLALGTPFSERFDLAAHGLDWLWPEVEYSHPLDGGRGASAWRSIDDTAAALPDGDGRRWRSLLGPFAASFDDLAGEIVRPMAHVPEHPLLLARFGTRAGLPVAALARALGSEEGRGLLAGVAAHAFRPFGSLMSAAIGTTLAAAAHSNGWPVAKGGSGAISAAMGSILSEHGGRVETGVAVTDLAELGSPDIVILDLAPAAAADLAGSRIPARLARGLRRFRHGPGAFKLDLAVEGGVPWRHRDSRLAGTVHVGGGYEEIADAERRVAAGEMPERPFVLVCQQYLADPSRSQGDVHPLYAYAHVPAGYTGDAEEAVLAQIERFAPGFRDRILARHARGPAAMAAHNPNYVGGDIVTGANDPLQMLFRPRITLAPYSLGAKGLYICSAATPPGAGAHGMCGFNAANRALRELSR